MLVLMCMISVPSVCAEADSIDVRLEKCALAHAEKLNALLSCEEYLNLFVAQLYLGDGDEFLNTLAEVDFTAPRKTLTLIRPRSEMDLMRGFEFDEDTRRTIEEHAFQEICLAPLLMARPENKLYIRRVIEDLVVRSTEDFPEIDGAAYVIQLYDEAETLFLVTVFAADGKGGVLAHTEIVNGDAAGQSTQDRFVNLIGLIDVYTGEVTTEEFIQKTYRETNQ
ncbi:MAG: hypothetical protein IJE08_10770 [Clostridia bacterium]|nr:hypothetical protein [Clostridia bacterium]